MKIKQVSDNGNIHCNNYEEHPRGYSRSLGWSNVNNRYIVSENCSIDSITNNDSFGYISDSNINNYNSTTTYNDTTNGTLTNDVTLMENTHLVYNVQYKINIRNNATAANSDHNLSQPSTLETFAETEFTPYDAYQGNTDGSLQAKANHEERVFEHSDTDEISDDVALQCRLPRGIVNPNYPGFQHFAHTLQDYSSNIENFYHSENEMTDDDIDITDTSIELCTTQTELTYEDLNQNNNNCYNINTEITKNVLTIPCVAPIKDKSSNVKESIYTQEIPDLLKNITKANNNNATTDFNEFSCFDTDIENNFHAKDIIGDFNKEIEDEIKQLLNYNINVEDDLEELRKDIKDTFAQPIENTLNNISDVVNQVIKKLVVTHCDTNDIIHEDYDKPIAPINESVDNIDTYDICKENESNTRKEMNLSRPTFLLLDQNNGSKIPDAFLSDGKDEINIDEDEYECDADKISNSVENTIKQLSTELRKIIPKLDELRERDNLWCDSKVNSEITKDGNSNDVSSSRSKSLDLYQAENNKNAIEIKTKKVTENEVDSAFSRCKLKHKIAQRSSRDRRPASAVYSSRNNRNSASSNNSVRNHDSVDDCNLGNFDVYNIETAMPPLDLDTIETHLKAAKEAERRKRNDREEIRRRLAMGADHEDYYSTGQTDRPGKKPSLHSRMQSGMNLQICFMNETASDNESQASDIEKNTTSTKPLLDSIFSKSNYSLNNHPYQTRPLSVNLSAHERISSMQTGSKLRPSSLTLKATKSQSSHSLGYIELRQSDFHALQATLQTEARIALAQAKEMARIQMEQERRTRAVSPVTEMLRHSMEKASAPLAADRRRVSRQLLTDMNIAQLQVIVNELHSQIELLNDSLVKLLMARDELHMGQDSMLVDIEDLTRYLGVKEHTKKTKGNTKPPTMKRFTSLVHK